MRIDESWCRGHPALRSTDRTIERDLWLWKQEPVINSFRHMTFFNAKQQRNIDVPVAATPIALDGGEIVVASEDGFLRRYTNTFSEVRWETRVNARLYASPTVCEGRNMLIAASTKGHILAVNDDGVLLWRADLKECIYNSPLFCDRSNQIFVSSFNHKLFSLNASTGDLLWKRDLSAPWGNTFHATAGFRDPYAGPAPDFEGGCIQCSAEHISRYDSSGRQLWVKNTGHTVRTTAAISKPANVGLAGSVNGSAFLFDVRTGEIISTHRLNGRLMNSPAIVGDKGCIGSSAGDVVCIDVTTGMELWRRQLQGGLDHGSITWTPAGDFVMILSNGNAVGLAGSDGSFLWETSQVLELPLHRREIHQTPVVVPSGKMLANSYNGYVYSFQFRPANE